jgi:hypothetical protein
MNVPALMGTSSLTPTRLLPDGVYIGLSEENYFAQKRLGSSDKARLWKAPADWWWGSSFNPKKTEQPWKCGNDRDFGHAFHKLLLEGEEAYRERVVITDYDGFQSKDARAWRDTQHLNRLIILKPEHDEYVRHMVALVEHHPQLADAMADGLSEVSVFWTDEEGRRHRARFDKLLPSYIIDPKSYGAHNQGRDDHDRALRMVAARSYDVQRYDYDVAREKAVEFIKEGKVYGATPEQLAWLQRIPEADAARLAERMEFFPDGHPDQQSAWSWLWLFMQKPSNSKGHAPIVLPLERPRFDKTWRSGKMKVEKALENFDAYKARFGLGDEPNQWGEPAVPWASIHHVWRPRDEEFPNWLDDVSSREHFAPEEDESE